MRKKPKVKQPKDFGARYFHALLRYAERKGRLPSQGEIGRLVANELGRRQPLAQTTVGRWKTGALPDLKTAAAIAKVLDVDPGWLAFGDRSAAPGPAGQVANRAELLPGNHQGNRQALDDA